MKPAFTPIRPLKPEEIKAIREREHVSQTVFANYLNVTSGWSASGSGAKNGHPEPR
jgi:DNA-binding transcriptional regulator YiaG